MPQTKHSHQNALSEGQFDELFEATSTLRQPFDVECRLMLVAAGRLGMRAGEIVHMQEHWVDWEKSLIEIPSYEPCQKGRDGGPCGNCNVNSKQELSFIDEEEDVTLEEVIATRWKPKTSNSARAIPFDFNSRVEETIEEFFFFNDIVDFYRQTANRRVNRVLEAAGFPTSMCYPHALRATAATYHAYRGVAPVALQSMFGWADLGVAQKYIRLSGGATSKALKEAHGD